MPNSIKVRRGVDLNFKIPKEKAYERTIWLFKDANFDEFRNALTEVDFEECFDAEDVDVSCDRWSETFLNAARTHIPNKVITVRPNDSPWYTNELRTLKRKMIRAFHKHKRTKNENHWNNYKSLSNEYHVKLNEAEAKYKQSLCDTLSTSKNSKSWWSTVKWLLGKGGDTSYPAMNVNGKQITDNKLKAEEFNNSFLSYSNIDESSAELPPDEDFPQHLDSIVATEAEVYDLLKCVDPSKATGPDGISPRLLKEAGIAIVPSLTKLINLSLSLSKVPRRWKLAHVIPLFKKGEKSDPNNYRPVSLLSCVSKILERVVFKHLYNFLLTHKILSPHQSGFQPGDSTINQLSFLYHEIASALDNKKDVHIVFCDIKKAFDRVWHKGLIYKLKKIGICGVLLKWFIDYLTDRYQRVVIRGQKSEKGVIKAGVPQGSVLGPLLFLIYINDITYITQCKIKLFADDTSLYIDFDENTDATIPLNEDLHNIKLWSDQWLINFSPAKTKLLTCTYKNKQYPDVTFDNKTLASVESHKHLGLILSKDLTWTAHVNELLHNVSPMADVLKKLKYDLDRKSIEMIYFTFIRPKLEYAAQIWDNCSNKDAELLEAFQLDIARITTGARKGTSHQLLYNEVNWERLSERREKIKLKNLIKIVNKECPSYLQNLLPKQIHEVRPNSRQPDNFFLLKTRTETFRKSFIPSAVKLWNNTPATERNIDFIKASMCRKSEDLYNFGSRHLNVKHAQLRLNCSKLNLHLFNLHVIESPACNCGYVIEDCKHHFLHCLFYDAQRDKMLNCIKEVYNIDNVNDDSVIALLLFGSTDLDYMTNIHIFNAVHVFVEECNRL